MVTFRGPPPSLPLEPYRLAAEQDPKGSEFLLCGNGRSLCVCLRDVDPFGSEDLVPCFRSHLQDLLTGNTPTVCLHEGVIICVNIDVCLCVHMNSSMYVLYIHTCMNLFILYMYECVHLIHAFCAMPEWRGVLVDCTIFEVRIPNNQSLGLKTVLTVCYSGTFRAAKPSTIADGRLYKVP